MVHGPSSAFRASDVASSIVTSALTTASSPLGRTHVITLDSPGSSLCLKALPLLTSAVSLCHGRWHSHRVRGLELGHLWGCYWLIFQRFNVFIYVNRPETGCNPSHVVTHDFHCSIDVIQEKKGLECCDQVASKGAPLETTRLEWHAGLRRCT